MLSEFLKLLQDTAVKASGAQVVRLNDKQRNAYLVCNGDAKEVAIYPDPTNHSLLSVSSLIELAQTKEKEGAASQVWHSPDRVTLVIDTPDPRDVAVLTLEQSAAFKKLSCLVKAIPMTQRDLIRLLRHDFRNCGVEFVLSAVKRLDFKRSNDGRSHIEHGKESLGRSVEAQVNSAEAIPEFFNVTIPVYSTRGADFHKTVYCTLEIDPQNERFLVLPDEDSLKGAINDVQEELHELLESELGDIPVYFGNP